MKNFIESRQKGTAYMQ